MTRFVQALLVVMLIATITRADDKETQLDRDRKALQGVWVVEDAYRNGEKVPESARMEAHLYAIRIKDDTLQLSLAKDGEQLQFEGEPARLTLDVSVDPKVAEFGSETDKWYCIYSVKGDKLTLCLNYENGVLGDSTKDRSKLPKKLETKKGDGTYMFVLKKAK
jgi:uncharacterized protein (TIGR03067 family)